MVDTTHIVITGRVPSKKNSRKMFVVKGRLIIAPSSDYAKWHKDASKQVVAQQIQHFEKTAIVEIDFYAHDARKYDLSNKAESIMDLLVDNGILVDDNYSVVPHLSLMFRGIDRVNPRAEIRIN